MKNFLLARGRLAWPPVIAAVFLAIVTLALDLAWRVISIRFESLAICGALVAVVGLGAIFGTAKLTDRSRDTE